MRAMATAARYAASASVVAASASAAAAAWGLSTSAHEALIVSVVACLGGLVLALAAEVAFALGQMRGRSVRGLRPAIVGLLANVLIAGAWALTALSILSTT